MEIVLVSDVQHYYLPHKVYPADCDCVEALKRADSITIDGYKVADLSKKWLPIKKVSLRLTPAQQRRFTLTQFLKTLSNINKSAMKDYTKQWALQALHTKLATRYRTDRCHWCDVIIGYDHFFADCVFLYVFGNVWGDREDEMNQWLTGHLLWNCRRVDIDDFLDEAAKICKNNAFKEEERREILIRCKRQFRKHTACSFVHLQKKNTKMRRIKGFKATRMDLNYRNTKVKGVKGSSVK